jgi:hypothetical protein
MKPRHRSLHLLSQVEAGKPQTVPAARPYGVLVHTELVLTSTTLDRVAGGRLRNKPHRMFVGTEPIPLR